MPPEPHEYQGRAAIGAFLENRAVRRGAPLRLVPTRANGQPAFGCFFRDRPYGLLVVALEGVRIAAMTWFAEVCPVDGIHPKPGDPDSETAEQLYIDPSHVHRPRRLRRSAPGRRGSSPELRASPSGTPTRRSLNAEFFVAERSTSVERTAA